MNDDEPQLLKDLRQMAEDINFIARALAITIQYCTPLTDEGLMQLSVCQEALKNIYNRKLSCEISILPNFIVR